MIPIFSGDLVYGKIDNKLIAGLVRNTGLVADEDNPESKDQSKDGVKGEEIRILTYPCGQIKQVPRENVKLCDRPLELGDIVQKVGNGGKSQLGFCRSIDVKTDVQVFGTDKVILGVNNKDLEPIKTDLARIAVFKDTWVGLVRGCQTQVTLKFLDGSRCIMPASEASLLEDINDRREEFSIYRKSIFFPGQELYGPTYRFKRVEWIVLNEEVRDFLNQRNKGMIATVEEENVVSIDVDWVGELYSEKKLNNVQPLYRIMGEDLKSLKLKYGPRSLKVGDKNFLIVKRSQNVVSRQVWEEQMSARLNGQEMPSPSPKRKQAKRPVSRTIHTNNGTGQIYRQIKTNNNVNLPKKNLPAGSSVVRASASHSLKYARPPIVTSVAAGVVRSISHGYSNLLSQTQKLCGGTCGKIYEMFAKEQDCAVKEAPRKKRKIEPDNVTTPSSPTLGEKLVVEALITETKAEIVWKDGTVEKNVLSTSLLVIGENESDLFPGYYIIDKKESRPDEYGVVKKVDDNGKTALITSLKMYQNGANPRPEELSTQEVSLYDIEEHSRFLFSHGNFLIRVFNSEDSNPTAIAGQVVAFHPSGQVKLRLLNGQYSLCYPQELHTFHAYSKKLGQSLEEDSDGEDDYNWEDDIDWEDEIDWGEDIDWDEEFNFSRNNTTNTDLEMVDSEDSRDTDEEMEWSAEDSEEVNATNSSSLSSTDEDVSTNDSIMKKPSCSNKGKFLTVGSVPESHRYKQTPFQPKNPNAFFRIVQKEMKILKSSLPQDIIVKTFDNRLDLYSVLIKGPKGTPYEDGLFFFDFRLPSNYPYVPPLCHYVSYSSDHLNPNLYVDGKVCVSLLGTWDGTGTEIWNPATSNLLQVIVSIQGLILVSEPYFNEAGYEDLKGRPDEVEYSKQYNEKAILNLVEAMTKLLINPPELFQEEIAEHFKTHASKFVKRLEGWSSMSNTDSKAHSSSSTSPNGSKKQGAELPEFPLIPASKGFWLSLKKSLDNFKTILSYSDINLIQSTNP